MKLFPKSTKSSEKIITLTDDEEILLKELDIDRELCIAIKNKTNNEVEGLYELQELDDYPEDPKLKGIKSLIDEKITMPSIFQTVKELQAIAAFNDYHILCCGHYANEKEYFIGAIKTKDKYECLRIFETNGINYNLNTRDIIDFLQKWETQTKFSIIDAYHDRVIIQLLDLDFDLKEFARDCLKFCPDFSAVTENEEQMKNYIIERKGEIDFWWD